MYGKKYSYRISSDSKFNQGLYSVGIFRPFLSFLLKHINILT